MSLVPWNQPSKLIGPTLAELLDRPRLAGLPGRVTLLQAGPGFGKTVAMAQMAAAGAGPTVWYGMDESDTEVTTCFGGLVAALRAVVPPFGEDLLAAASTGQSSRALWQRFAAGLAAYDPPQLTLAIDDVHVLGPEGMAAFAVCFDRLPAGVRLMVSTRKRWPSGIGRLLTTGLVQVVGEEGLRLSPEEAAAFLAIRRPAGSQPVPAASLAAVDGWPLGLVALAASPDGHWSATGASLVAYVAEELFASQPAERQHFLLGAALVGELTADACRAVLEKPDAATDLDALEADHLLQRFGTVYRFPGYFQAFLLAEGERLWPQAMRRALHRRVGDYLVGLGKPEQALPSLVAAEAWDVATDACCQCFSAMRFEGRHAAIQDILATFPPPAFAQDPRLWVWQGHALARGGQLVDAEVAYERALKGFDAQGDRTGRLKVLVCQANLALAKQDAPRYGTLLLEAAPLIDQGHAEDRADLALIRSHAAEQTGDFAAFARFNEQVLELPVGDSVELAASHTIAHLNLYTFALHRGQLGRARSSLEQAIALAKAWRFFPYQLFAQIQQAHLSLLEGCIDDAARALKALPDDWHGLLDWHDLACALVVEGQLATSRGQWREAEEALHRSMALFKQIGFTEGVKIPLEILCWTAIARTQPARVEALIAEADLLEPDYPSLFSLALALPRARAFLLLGRANDALILLDAALPSITALDAKRHVALGLALAAAAKRATGDAAGASASLDKARLLVTTAGLDFLFTQYPDLWTPGIPPVEAISSETPVGQPSPSHAASLPVAKQLADRSPTPPLAIHVWGIPQVFLGGQQVTNWPRKVAWLILAALVLNPRGLTLAELAERVGDEDALDLTRFKVAVSMLRRILEPGLAHARDAQVVVLVGDRYRLQPEAIAYVDVWAMDQALGRAERAASPSLAIAEYEAALGHCRGELLDSALFRDRFDADRELWRARVLAATLRLATLYETRSAAADTLLTRMLTLLPAEEEIALALMRVAASQGQFARVRTLYWDCRKAIKALRGVTTSPAFDIAYRSLIPDNADTLV